MNINVRPAIVIFKCRSKHKLSILKEDQLEETNASCADFTDTWPGFAVNNNT